MSKPNFNVGLGIFQGFVITACIICETVLILHGKFNGWIIAPAIIVIL